uniref:DNA-directed DNA polymerase n=1 Tax=Phylloscopus inornatus parvoviridae sp. TaxID=2794539 RepID=A0A8E7G1Y8_9VIRU|nr:MAG: structural protein [Phylloscopus inornatus parvoviridae sp.]
MAVAINPANIEYGYFFDSNYDRIKEYIKQLILINEDSVVIQIHPSGRFKKDDEVRVMHMPPRRPLILDPQMDEDEIDFLLDNLRGLCNDVDNYEEFECSGWMFLGDIKYWVKIYPCQPNPTPDVDDSNMENFDDDNDGYQSDNERSRSPMQVLNSLIAALACYFITDQLPRGLDDKRLYIENYIADNIPELIEYMYMKNFKLNKLGEWHEEFKKYNIRVFSIKGNVLYAKKMEDSEDWINLYLNSKNQFAFVYQLGKLFKKRLDYVICDICFQLHNVNKECQQKIVPSEEEDVKIMKIPEGRHGLVTYADFESVLKPEENHDVSGYSFLTIDGRGKIFYEMTANKLEKSNIIEDFVNNLFLAADAYASGPLEDDGTCGICGYRFKKDENPVRKRNFITGVAKPCHFKCWFDYKNSMFVFFHNFRGYDSHFLMETLCDKYEVYKLQATNMEKFNMICIRRKDVRAVSITFKDTFNFFTTSLAKCVDTVENWKYTDENYRDSKGIFPYEWFDDIEKLRDNQLPPGPWINKLSNTVVDSTPAEEIWKKEKFEFFAQYHDFYCKLDTYQLADVFEEFRRTCVQEFRTDPVYFMGAPALTWYLGLRNNIDLFKIIKDEKIYLEIQSQIRGGVSQAMVRYHEVEPDKDSILFLDVNSLYSKCMTYKMPGRYIETIEELPENWRELFNENTEYTALLKVDLEYPAHLHDRDWAYPLAPHKYNDRLCTTFLPKYDYLVHAELLDFYLSRGMVLVKFHYGYVFEQDYTLRDYVDNNINKRIHTNSEVMKTLYKLLNNSLYGKTCENVFKYKEFDVIQDDERNEELANCKNMIGFNESFLIEKDKKEIILNKPIQIGFTILEFAKREIYRFLSVVQDEFKNDVVPMYTDTDSIMFGCNFVKPWEKFYNSEKIRPFLDFDKVPDHWGVRTPHTNKVSGLWSVEANGKTIVKYIGLRSKCYAYMFEDDTFVGKNKGVPKSSLAVLDNGSIKDITFEDYEKALFGGEDVRIKHLAIRSNKHQVTTQEIYKLGISGNDLKRIVHSNQRISLPFGYLGELYNTNDFDDPDNLERWRPKDLENGRW